MKFLPNSMPSQFHHLPRAIAAAALAFCLASASSESQAQEAAWPSKPIRIVVPSAAGGAADFVGRTFGHYLEQRVKQPVVIENKPGASGIVGAEAVKSSAPDGHTFLLAGNSTQSANLVLFSKLTYDPSKDFEEVGIFGQFSAIGMTKQDSAINSTASLVAQVKKNRGKVTYGYYSASSQVPPELIKAQTGIEATGVSYKNITQIITDLAGGIVDFAFLDSLSAAPALQSGLLKPIAVTSPQRLPILPNVPTVAETLPGFEMQGWLGLAAPAGTSKALVDRMNAFMRDAVADPGVRSALEGKGMTVKAATTAEQLAFVIADRLRWAEWVRIAHIQPQ